jgi:tetratricopeptide (TPR) repeat protein
MDNRKVHAFPLFLLLLITVIFASSCSDVKYAYDKGNYRQVVAKVSRMKNPSQSDLILKAKSYFALEEEDKALESLLLYLMSDESTQTPEDRSYAVSAFISLDAPDSLVLMVLKPEDGTQAQMALYRSYSRTGDIDNARNMLSYLSGHLDFTSYIELMFSAPVDSDYMLETFAAWYTTIDEQELDTYLSLLCRFSREISMGEVTAKRFLSLTDVLLNNAYYTENDINLSTLLKIKGNILEKLYDKVNARIYWTQAFRLNPDDEELKGRLQ